MEMENRIRILSALAVYDKKYGDKDRNILKNTRGDYIYIRNLITGICTLIGLGIIYTIYMSYLLFVKDYAIVTMEIKAFALKMLGISLIVIAIYTLISTLKSIWEYDAAKMRIEEYESLLGSIYDIGESEQIDSFE